MTLQEYIKQLEDAVLKNAVRFRYETGDYEICGICHIGGFGMFTEDHDKNCLYRQIMEKNHGNK